MSSQHDPSSRPPKRQKTSSDEPSNTSSFERDASFWFEDGSIILISNQRTGFRVHLGVLSLNAEFFRDMSGLAVPDAKGDTMIDLEDSTQDLTHFLHVLYTRSYFCAGTLTSYDTLESLLRMSTKYLAQQLRSDVIKHLTMIYPSELADLGKHTDLILPCSDLHSLRAIAMGREHNVPIILPAAYYYASTLPTTELVANVKPDILAMILAGRENIVVAAYNVAWSWLYLESRGSTMCLHVKRCYRKRLGVIKEIAKSPGTVHCLLLDAMPHDGEGERDDDVDFSGYYSDDLDEESFCRPCLLDWCSDEDRSYKQLWYSLPSYFDLPEWEVLLKGQE
ncbi:hypothetical protein EV421DRAFT_1425229 [Armillaria borealis]|uniref:BTB domain-containing protein n=1 Tax=Armillaria borealis TaxID=47425 RepID=A0AA39JXZ2_9AGAR|nr:hypothetical protein EV421DRAFT_1425229 [Armillaria borealis]